MNDYTSIADLYDLYVTDTRDHAFWSRCAARAEGPILELTAGTGRVTVALRLASSQSVVALDLAPAMLRRLTGRFHDGPRPVRAVAGDLTALPFAPEQFGLVVIPFNSLGELIEAPQRASALHELRRVLAPFGRAVVTLHNPSRRRLTLDGEVRRLGPFWVDRRRLEVLVRGRAVTAEVAVSEQTYRVLGPDDRVLEERSITLRFALPDARSLMTMTRAAGWRYRPCSVTTMSRPMNRRTVRSFLLCSSGPRSSARPNPRTQPTGRKGARCHSGGALRESR